MQDLQICYYFNLWTEGAHELPTRAVNEHHDLSYLLL